jgi:hypothetical protein
MLGYMNEAELELTSILKIETPFDLHNPYLMEWINKSFFLIKTYAELPGWNKNVNLGLDRLYYLRSYLMYVSKEKKKV